jgi:hypothetical protein
MNTDRWIALAGIVVGVAALVVGIAALVVAFWQWHDAKKKGHMLLHFLLGLKADEQLTATAKRQINDMIAWLNPPKEKADVPPPPPAATDAS